MTTGRRNKNARSASRNPLLVIPGVGKSIAEDMNSIGISTVNDLKNRDPEELYRQLCQQAGTNIDRCVLYVFRCAVYYASSLRHEPELLKWWNWKDGGFAEPR